MSKRGIVIATAIVVMGLIAFKNDPVTGQSVISNLLNWILP